MSTERQELFDALGLLGEAYPNLRLGQLLITAGNWAARQPDALWDVTDDELLTAVHAHLERTGVAELASTTE